MAQKLQGKVALVTGGSSGIGFATAKQFIEEGAFVFITGRRPAELAAAAQKLGPNAVAVQGDVTNLDDLDDLYATIRDRKKHLDVLFVNAGSGTFAPIDQITEAHFDSIFNLNVKGLVFTVQKALPLLKDGASIILNASIVAALGMEAFSVYSASKAAVRSFARSWATDLKHRQIRVNAVSPGVVPTEAYSTALKMTDEQIKQFGDNAAQNIPLGRVGRPEEIAKAVTFLASNDSSYVNGFDLIVDGGMTQV